MPLRFISERRKTGSRRLGKHIYPKSDFNYLNYDTDPKPSVLILGDWKSPKKNNLLAGINLNYLSSGQLIKLRKAAKRIFSRDSLRARYRYLKSILPDIAMFYRTYDAKYIKGIEHNQLDSYAKAKPSSKDERVKTTADAAKAVQTSEPKKDTDERVDDLDREAWRLKRRLYEPAKQRRRTSPERIGIAGSKAAKKAKATRYVRDRRKLKELERQVELAKELRKMDEIPDEPPEEPEEIEEPEDDYGPEYHLDDLGYESYIRSHKPGSKLISESKQKNLFAVFDTLSEQFIVDSVLNHAEMLFDAGWDYDHTVLFEVTSNELVVRSDCSDTAIKHAIECFRKHAVKDILLESRIDPEPEACNRCGEPWPEE